MKRKKLLLWLILCVLVIGGGWYYFSRIVREPVNLVAGELFPEGELAEDGHLPDMTDDEIREQMQMQADEPRFSFKINAEPVFESGTSEGTLRIENPNHNIYPMAVEITLAETGEKIFESGGILPSQHIDTAALMKNLSKGT